MRGRLATGNAAGFASIIGAAYGSRKRPAREPAVLPAVPGAADPAGGYGMREPGIRKVTHERAKRWNASAELDSRQAE